LYIYFTIMCFAQDFLHFKFQRSLLLGRRFDFCSQPRVLIDFNFEGIQCLDQVEYHTARVCLDQVDYHTARVCLDQVEYHTARVCLDQVCVWIK